MLDLLVAVGQVICVTGLVYGFIIVMVHADCVDTVSRQFDLMLGRDRLEIKTVRDDSARHNGAVADSDSRDRRSRGAIHVD